MLEDITLTGFQRKFKTLTNSSPSGNVASLRSLLGNRCITFPFTSSKIQQRKAGLIRNSENFQRRVMFAQQSSLQDGQLTPIKRLLTIL